MSVTEAMTGAEDGRIRIGQVLGQAFGTLGRNVVTFVVLSALIALPLLVLGLAGGAQEEPAVAELDVLDFVPMLLWVVLNAVATAAITFGAIADLRGRRATLGACLKVGLGRAVPAAVVGFLATVAAGLAAILLVIPGLIVLTILFVAVPVAVVERPGIFASFGRSARLTRGNRWRVFGIVVVGAVIVVLLSMVGGFVSVATAVSGTAVLQWIFQVLTWLLWSVILASTYVALRTTKEGVDAETLAAVFD